MEVKPAASDGVPDLFRAKYYFYKIVPLIFLFLFLRWGPPKLSL
jgi:hypothetical protein